MLNESIHCPSLAFKTLPRGSAQLTLPHILVSPLDCLQKKSCLRSYSKPWTDAIFMGLRVAWRNVIALNSNRKLRSRRLISIGFPLHKLNDSLWTSAHTLLPYILFHTCSLSPSPFPGLQFPLNTTSMQQSPQYFEVRIIRFVILFSRAVS